MAIDIATARTEIAKLYIAAFNRVPDSAGLDFWVDSYVNKGQTLDQIANNFTNSTEYTTKYPAYQTNAEYVEAIYVNVFGRASDATGKAYWEARLVSTGADALTHGTLMNAMVAAAGTNGSTDGQKLTNQATFAIDAVLNNLDITSATNQLANITSDTATIATATAATSAAITGETILLTTGVDSKTGTNGNDLFIADNTGTTEQTSSADSLNGGAGTDTLKIYSDGTIAALPSLTAIENVVIYDEDTNLSIANAAWSSVTNATFVRNDGQATYTVGANVTTVNLEDMVATDTANAGTALEVTLAAAATSVTLGLNGITANGTDTDEDVEVNGAALTTITVNTSGTASSFDSLDVDAATSITLNAAVGLTATSLATTGTDASVTVSGAGAVSLGALSNNVKTFNATTNTGGVTVTSAANRADASYTLSAGNDVFTTDDDGFATTDTFAVNAGAGTADVLNIAAAADIDTTAEGARYTNFEVVRIGNVAQDMAKITGSTITAIQKTAGGAALTNMTATQAGNVTLRADDAGSTYALATATGTSDVLSVTMANTTATASADLTTATITGFETLNVVSSTGSAADKNALSFTAAGDLTALNISGAKAITVSTTNITKAATIDASAMTYTGTTSTDYALAISGNLVKGSTVTATGAADSITTTATVAGTSGDYVVYNAGAGNDAISSTVAAINNTTGANASVKIDGGAGTDTLALTDAASLTMVDANFQYITNVETLSYTVANKAINITTGGFFNTNFANGATVTLGDATNAQANTVDMTSYTGNATLSLTATAASTVAQNITTGSGNDTVTLLAAGTTTGALAVNTGSGNDTINVTLGGLTSGAVTINAGAGQDTITITGDAVTADAGANQVYVINEGHSTVSAYDTIIGSLLSNGTDQGTKLDFEGANAANANVASSAVTGYTAGELTYTVTNGLLAFAGTSASSLTVTQKIALAQQLITTDNKAVAFTYTNADSTVDSYVYCNGVTTDSLVKLQGTTLLGIDANTTGYVDIA